MRALGTLFPVCEGGQTIDGVCPICGRLSKPRQDGQTRRHEDARAWVAPLVDHRLSITERARQVGSYYQVVELLLRRYPWIKAARQANRAEDKAARQANRAEESLQQAMERAIRFNRHCRTCGSWVIRADRSLFPACSPECSTATLVCFQCRQLKPASKFRGGVRGRGGSVSLCNLCNRKRAGEWHKAHRGQFTPISERPCKACQSVKPASEFWLSTSSKSGLQTYCKACQSELAAGKSVVEIARSHGKAYRRTRQRFEVAR